MQPEDIEQYSGHTSAASDQEKSLRKPISQSLLHCLGGASLSPAVACGEVFQQRRLPSKIVATSPLWLGASVALSKHLWKNTEAANLVTAFCKVSTLEKCKSKDLAFPEPECRVALSR